MRNYSWIFFLMGHEAMAQTNLDEFFYQEGKFYVVVAVLVIIFCILAAYLFRLDKKISKIEKEKNEA
ncbi:CcmD family protein [Bacteroidia bacterium]|nr:CcmD family protein [Bacteroidia bacterium]